MSVAPVTHLQWRHFYEHAGKAQGLPLQESDATKLEDHPVVNVSWLDAQAYVAWLCASTGQVYSLPSEAQWEYAARAGTTTRFWTGNTITTAQANFDDNHDCDINIQRHCTTPVNAFAPNPWGLLDMLGNTWEWCQDVWHDTHLTAYPDGRARSTGADETQRTIRGGSFSTLGGQLDSRFGMKVDASNDCLGFRVARQQPAKKLRHFADLPVDNSKAEPFWPADVF